MYLMGHEEAACDLGEVLFSFVICACSSLKFSLAGSRVPTGACVILGLLVVIEIQFDVFNS